ncbi:hypothetical protein L596_005233 [Steinernema carpocapsae]|uniref:Cadherin domain-containing protein n=1 Tax=Steinernema carpocapsae TaxID=34508 RepID=A0A4U8V1Z6_STECR|nr:hypothetical protein L596_005233 [Steinernema carpocapsae]
MVRGNLQPGARYQIVLEAQDGGGRSSRTVIVALANEDTILGQISSMGSYPSTQLPHAEDGVKSYVAELDEASPPRSIVVSLGVRRYQLLVECVIFNFRVTSLWESRTKLFTATKKANSRSTKTREFGNHGADFTRDLSGTITTEDYFDREKTASYNLQIEAKQKFSGQHLYWVIVQVVVKDVNDNSPQFHGPQPMRLTMKIDNLSELKPNMFLGRVQVSDADESNGRDGNGDVSLSIAPPMNRLFTVDDNGVVSVNGDLSTEHFGFHRLSLIASDHGDPPRKTHATLLVEVGGPYVTEPAAEYSSLVTEARTTNKETNEVDENDYTTFFSLATLPPTYQKPFVPGAFNGLQNYQTTPVPLVTSEELVEEEVQETEQTQSNFAFSLPSSTPPPEPSTFPTQEVVRFAPVFNPANVNLMIEENEGQVELAKLHASYPDGGPGSVTYIMQAGDPSLFSVSSYTGTLSLLKPLDAESGENQYTVRIGTAESAALAIDAQLPHSAEVTIKVVDVNDWIPNFETNSYHFAIPENTEQGTIVGQVAAFDQDRDEPNKKISYHLVSRDNMDHYFSINDENGLITLSRSVAEFVGQNVTLRVEARDHGEPSQFSQTVVIVSVEPSASKLIKNGKQQFTSNPTQGSVQFSLRNYTASVSEAVRPPYLVQVLTVLNKPVDSRFIMCSIVSGNFGGAFGVSPGADGNCELRTNIALDRESVERYLLNITVTSGTQTDFAFVSVTILDANDNVPKFIYDNDLQLPIYFVGISSSAPALTRVITVKAEDADLGNSSMVKYSLDPLHVDSKYFTINEFGEVSTKQSLGHLTTKNKKSVYELKAVACDSPITGQTLCSKADIVVNIIGEQHRFVTTVNGISPQQFGVHQNDVIKTLRQFTGPCTWLGVEKMRDYSSSYDGQIMVDVFWYAINPSIKKICRKQEYKKLFDRSAKELIAGKLRPWFALERIAETAFSTTEENDEKLGLLPADWNVPNTMVIVLGLGIALVASVAIIIVVFCFARYRSSRSIHTYPDHYHFSKHPIHLQQQTMDRNKIYETQVQMLELPISDEDMTLKNSSMRSANPRPGSWCDPRLHPNAQAMNSSRNYGRQHQIDEGDFSIEESMYAVNASGSVDPITKCVYKPW